MADPLTDYSENLVARWITKGEIVPAGSRHLAIFSDMPTDAGGGTEIAAGGIARLASAAANWAAPVDSEGGKLALTSANHTFAAVTVAQADALAWAIFDAAAAGNMLWYAALRQAVPLPVGKVVYWPAATLGVLIGSAEDLLTDYTENLIARWITKGEAMAAGNRWITLFSADPTDAGSGAEITGDGFVRTATAAADWNAPVDANGGKMADNAVDLSFAAPTADKPNATHWGILDAAAAGNLLAKGALKDEVSLPTGRVLRFPAGFFRVPVGA